MLGDMDVVQDAGSRGSFAGPGRAAWQELHPRQREAVDRAFLGQGVEARFGNVAQPGPDMRIRWRRVQDQPLVLQPALERPDKAFLEMAVEPTDLAFGPCPIRSHTRKPKPW